MKRTRQTGEQIVRQINASFPPFTHKWWVWEALVPTTIQTENRNCGTQPSSSQTFLYIGYLYVGNVCRLYIYMKINIYSIIIIYYYIFLLDIGYIFILIIHINISMYIYLYGIVRQTIYKCVIITSSFYHLSFIREYLSLLFRHLVFLSHS